MLIYAEKGKPPKHPFICQVSDAGFLSMRQSRFKSMQRLLQFSRSLASSPPSLFHFIKCSWAHASWALSRESDSWLRENAFHCPFQKNPHFNHHFLIWPALYCISYSWDAPITQMSHGDTKWALILGLIWVIWCILWLLQQVLKNRISTVSRSNDIGPQTYTH